MLKREVPRLPTRLGTWTAGCRWHRSRGTVPEICRLRISRPDRRKRKRLEGRRESVRTWWLAQSTYAVMSGLSAVTLDCNREIGLLLGWGRSMKKLLLSSTHEQRKTWCQGSSTCLHSTSGLSHRAVVEEEEEEDDPADEDSKMCCFLQLQKSLAWTLCIVLLRHVQSWWPSSLVYNCMCMYNVFIPCFSCVVFSSVWICLMFAFRSWRRACWEVGSQRQCQQGVNTMHGEIPWNSQRNMCQNWQSLLEELMRSTAWQQQVRYSAGERYPWTHRVVYRCQ